MRILQSINEVKKFRKSLLNKSVGFVPTMGALHEGHLALIKEAKKKTEVVVVSIFVNPLQFNDPFDFKNYPKTEAQDLQLLNRAEVDALWLPQVSDLYPHKSTIKLTESDFSLKLCGASRPGHFDGVLTVVMKLFGALNPDIAFFGEKDFQQLKLIQKMVHEFFLDIEIISVPTLREDTGLALSSRNLRLNNEEKKTAPLLYKTLNEASNPREAKKRLEEVGFKVDYVEDIESRRFAAAWLGDVRLIDNVEI